MASNTIIPNTAVIIDINILEPVRKGLLAKEPCKPHETNRQQTGKYECDRSPFHQIRRCGELQFFAQPSHECQGQGEPDSRAECEYK